MLSVKPNPLPMVTRAEAGAEFEVYLESAGSYAAAGDNARDLMTTDENGFAITKPLPFGTYTVHQTKGEAGKEMIADFNVTINQHNKVYPYCFNDASLTAQIKVVKLDADSGEPITAGSMKFQIYGKHGNTPITLDDSDTFSTDNSGTAMLPTKLPAGEYRLVEVKAPTGYVISSEPVPFTVTGENDVVEVTLTNKVQMGKLSITKTGKVFASTAATQPIYNTAELAGAVYEVIADEDITTGDGVVQVEKDTVVATLTTDENGTAESDELYLGKYRLKEIMAPVGMALSEEETPVELTYAGQEKELSIATATVTDEPQSVQITLRKEFEGEDGKEVYEAVRFGLFTAEEMTARDGTKLEKDVQIAETGLEMDNDGFVGQFAGVFPFGKYYVKETATHGSYLLSTEEFPIELSYDETGAECVEVSVNEGEAIKNYRRPPRVSIAGTVELKKTDAKTGKPLSGAIFELYVDTNGNARLDSEDGLYGTLHELDNGVHRLTNLPEGGYFVKEHTAPQGYVRDEAAYYVNIISDGQTVTVENSQNGGFTNEPEEVVILPETGSLQITKTAEGGDPDGFEIEVKSADGSYRKVFITPKDGVITVTGLTPGSYTVTELETERSRLYRIPAAVTVTVTADKTAQVALHNALLPTNVPQTGGGHELLLWGGLGVCALMGLCTLLILRKKNTSQR